MTTAVQNGALRHVTDTSTGESLTLLPQDAAQQFSYTAYLDRVTSDEYVQQQQALAAAYDRVCKALIGPNDVQREGQREFKKKSAWRKLQRHFDISTHVVSIRYVDVPARGSVHNEDRVVTTAEVVVEAVAPWGQRVQAVGACGYDEESEPEERTGRNGTYMTKGKEITLATMVSTAETRATNRAVSNLIAMGEVSAEEMPRQRGQYGAPNGSAEGNARGGTAKGSPSGPAPTSNTATGSSGTSSPLTDAQLKYALQLAHHAALTNDEKQIALQQIDKAKTDGWDKQRFSRFIDKLKAATEKEGDTTPSGTATNHTSAAQQGAPAPTADTTTSTSPNASTRGEATTDAEPDYEVEELDDSLPF